MILASQSPRRIELMHEAGYNIRVIPADIDETPFDGEAPLTLVERLARAKAAAVAAEHAEPNELTVAADTIVTFDGKILGKPANEDEARTMLRELSGRTRLRPASASLKPATLQLRMPPRVCRLSM